MFRFLRVGFLRVGFLLVVVLTAATATPARAATAIGFTPIAATPYTLHADWSDDALATRLRATVDRSGAPTLGTLMHDLDDRTAPCDAAQRAALPLVTVDTSFCWDAGDSMVRAWTPQGITGSADGAAGGVLEGQTFTAVSWYYDGTPDKGVRISFVDADHTAYRNVLLVDPTSTTNFAAVGIHAAGISLAGHYLYVTALTGGLHVFDLDKLMTVSTGHKTTIGRSGSAWYAYGYRYVLPQVARYTPRGPTIRYSSLALDRSTTPDTLVVSEYSRSPGGRIVAFPVDPTTRRLIAHGGTVTAIRAVRMSMTNVQGAAAADGVYYVGTSNGAYAGSVYAGTVEHTWAIGGEDMYLDGGELWSLTEHAYCDWSGTSCGTKPSNKPLDKRIVFAVPQAALTEAPS